MSSYTSSTPRRPRKKTFNENFVDFLVTIGFLALAGGAGYFHAWKSGALTNCFSLPQSHVSSQ